MGIPNTKLELIHSRYILLKKNSNYIPSNRIYLHHNIMYEIMNVDYVFMHFSIVTVTVNK